MFIFYYNLKWILSLEILLIRRILFLAHSTPTLQQGDFPDFYLVIFDTPLLVPHVMCVEVNVW